MDNKTIKGVIYILTNSAFPKYVKIGYANNLKDRLSVLNRSSAIPEAFMPYAVYEVDRKLTDKKLHKLIDTLNPNLRSKAEYSGKKHPKEFFAMSAAEAYSLLECIATISGTQENLKRVDQEGHVISNKQTVDTDKIKTHKPCLTFSEYGIPVGAKLVYANDRSVVAIVLNDKKIEYKGRPTTMSALAQKLLGYKNAVQGPKYFMYNGMLLTDIRKQAEKKKS